VIGATWAALAARGTSARQRAAAVDPNFVRS
jgi:hypothetical protein